MSATTESAERKAFSDALIAAGHFVPTEVRGLVGRGAIFEGIVRGFGRLLDAFSEADGAERLYFPPLVPRTTLEKTGYLESMPQLLGLVHGFCGDDAHHRELVQVAREGGDWSGLLERTDLALAPAACYPLYPTCRGQVGPSGRLVDLDAGYVFRREPSDDPARLQMFRQREMVRIGTAEAVQAWRETWMARATALLSGLGLNIRLDVASDPFFGRGGRLRSATQRQQELKFEILAPVAHDEAWTAITSFNYHLTHFGEAFAITTEDGSPAHTACLGFGAERVTLALLRRHGVDVAGWPAEVKGRLGL